MRKALKCEQILEQGRNLSLAEANALKRKLLKNPNDLNTRLLLLGFNSARCHRSKCYAKEDMQQRLWFIDHKPEHPILNHCYRPLKRSEVLLTQKHWLAQVRRQPTNIKILSRAAWNSGWYFPKTAERLLKRAICFNPNNPDLFWQMWLNYSCQARNGNSSQDRRLAKKACAIAKVYLDMGKRFSSDRYFDNKYRKMEICSMADLALEFRLFSYVSYFGEYLLYPNPKAKEAGESRLGVAPRYRYLKYIGHQILGKLAMAKNDREKAKFHLKEMTKTFDPSGLIDLELSAALLDAKEKTAVTEYLAACAKQLKQRVKKYSKKPANKNRVAWWLRTKHEETVPSMPFNKFLLIVLKKQIKMLDDWQIAISKGKKPKICDFL